MSRPRVNVALRGHRWYSRFPAINRLTLKESTFWAIPEEALDSSSKSRSKEQAEEIVAALRTRVREGKTAYIPWYENGQLLFEIPVVEIKAPTPTIKDFVECYWNCHGSAKKSSSIIRSQLNAVVRQIGSLTHKSVTDEELGEWLKSMKEKGYSNRTMRTYFFWLQTVCKYCYKRKKLGGEVNLDILNYLLKGKVPVSDPRRQWFTEETFEKFYLWFKQRNPPLALFFLACYQTGSRLQETAEYRWEWVNERLPFEAPSAPKGAMWRYIEVPPEVNKEEQTDNEVLIKDRLWEELLKVFPRKEDRVEGLLFKNPSAPNTEKKFVPYYWNSWIWKLREAFPGKWQEGGADTIVFRDTRRSRNTNNMLQGMDKETAKALTKHKSDTCFQMYDGRDKRVLMMKSLHPEWFAAKTTESGQGASDMPKLASGA